MSKTGSDAEYDPALLMDQHAVLQTRIGLYASRLWQMPIGFIALVLSAAVILRNDTPIVKPSMVFWALVPVGLILGLCMVGVAEGAIRSIKKMIEIEQQLPVLKATKLRSLHWMPYFILVAYGIAMCVMLAISL